MWIPSAQVGIMEDESSQKHMFEVLRYPRLFRKKNELKLVGRSFSSLI